MLRHNQLPPIPTEPRALPDGPLYFVGVGGAGMSSIAQVLAERGRVVAGGDPGISDTVRARLERVGVRVFKGHDASQVGDAAVVVVSDAIPENNPEVIWAQERGLPIFRRPEVLGAIVNAGRGIAIAGTHGKTTTTGMVASILLAADLDPTIILGGDLPAIGGNARNGKVGKGDIVLAESCEAYDGFLYLHPEIAVVLNIEADHLDYHGDEAHVIASFERFLRQVNSAGTSIVCGDDQITGDLLKAIDAQDQKAFLESIEIPESRFERPMYVTYGLLHSDYMYSAKDVVVSGANTSFTLVREDFVAPQDRLYSTGEIRIECFNMAAVPSGYVTLGVPGRHNVLNAVAAAAVGFELGISQDAIVAGLESFTGTGRRFERIGEAGGVLIVDDYAHHPTELRATLAAARSAYPDRRIVAVFQPHLPSRTRDNMDAFADALTLADAVYLTDIYLAREQPLPGISSETLAERTRQAASARPEFAVAYVPDKNDLPARLAADVRTGDIVLTMGAGDIRAAGEKLFELVSLSPRPRTGNKTMKRVAVLMGGKSAEREVSLATGWQIVDSLDKTKYTVTSLDVDELPRLAVMAKSERPEVVVIALHGPGGEDGTVQGFLDVLGIPYTGSGVLASALAMDKVRCKAMLGTENIILPMDVVYEKWDVTRIRRAARDVAQDLGFPVVVKPSRQGSTYGTTVVEGEDGLLDALKLAFKYDTTAIVEQKIEGTEITVACIGNRQPTTLPIVEILTENGFFDYQAKYSTEEGVAAREIVPARITEAEAEEAREIALRCHQLLGCRGMSRTDMFVTEDGVVTLEVNTIPGMTPTSLLPKAAAAAGISFPNLLDGLINLALEKSL